MTHPLRLFLFLLVITLGVCGAKRSKPGRRDAAFLYQSGDVALTTEVYDSSGKWLATFTEGARTVTLRGPERTFTEPTAAYPVRTTVWVRLLPRPFTGIVDEVWLQARLADTSADILQYAREYLVNAPPLLNASGVQIAGDASYGPLLADGTRQEGSDFNDYLGLSWKYADGTLDASEAPQLRSLDCSGFVRMVWGYRGGMPLSLSILADHSTLPRRAFQLYEGAPGRIVLANSGQQRTDFSSLHPGDLVFFDAATDDGTQLDHVGIYLGVDTGGFHRFISSRKSIDGPTLGDYAGKSILDGTGLYAKAFRAARRL